VWLRSIPDRAGRTVTWYVLDVARGRLVARLELPRSWRVLGGDDHRVLVLRRDENDVEYVAVCTVVP
jgi:hypothetical protein